MTEQIRGLSLTQPWATLVAIGAKKIETRGWRTNYRGWLAIHATKTMSADDIRATQDALFQRALTPEIREAIRQPVRSAIVAVARLVECRWTGTWNDPTPDWVRELSLQEKAFGNFSGGRLGWFLEDVSALQEPVPARGHQSLWALPTDVLEQVIRHLPARSLTR